MPQFPPVVHITGVRGAGLSSVHRPHSSRDTEDTDVLWGCRIVRIPLPGEHSGSPECSPGTISATNPSQGGDGSQLGLEHLGAPLHHVSDAVLRGKLLLGVPAVLGHIPRVQEAGHGLVQPLVLQSLSLSEIQCCLIPCHKRSSMTYPFSQARSKIKYRLKSRT